MIDRMIRFTLIFLAVLGIQQNVFAACLTDRYGEVYCGRGNCALDKHGKVSCSRYLFGDAVLNKEGNTVCGKGKCVLRERFDDFYCSSIETGGAAIDRLGAVRCYGGCELASASMCESVKGR
jgi:hypothetical protein